MNPIKSTHIFLFVALFSTLNVFAKDYLCIDSASIDPNKPCYMIYAPVCGCDGVTYENDCIAEANGVVSFTYGACGQDTTTCGLYPYFFWAVDADHKTVTFMNYTIAFSDGDDVVIDSNGVVSTQPNNGTPLGLVYEWDFGDGNTSTATNPVHTYLDTISESIVVCLTVTDTINSCVESYCVSLNDDLYKGDCDADFEWEMIIDPNAGVDSFVFFINSPVIGDSNTVVSWSFGDGAVVNSQTSANVDEPGHSFPNEGTFTVCMSISNTDVGCFDIVCHEVQYNKTSSLKEQRKQKFELSVYPNPAQHQLAVRLDTQDQFQGTLLYLIKDFNGRVLRSGQSATGQFNVNIEGVANGLYFIETHTQSGMAISRFAVVK